MCITLVNDEPKNEPKNEPINGPINEPISEPINRLKRIFINEVCLYQGNLSDFKIYLNRYWLYLKYEI